MVKVDTDNGSFNISTALYEAILNRDPELLVEKSKSRKKARKKLSQHTQTTAEANAQNEIEPKETSLENETGGEDDKPTGIDPDNEILFRQILKNGWNITNGIEIDGKKYSKNDIKKCMKHDPIFKQRYLEFKKDKKARKLSREIRDEEEKQAVITNYSELKNLHKILHSPLLADQIERAEAMADMIIRRSNENIKSTLGLLFGTYTSANPDEYPTTTTDSGEIVRNKNYPPEGLPNFTYKKGTRKLSDAEKRTWDNYKNVTQNTADVINNQKKERRKNSTKWSKMAGIASLAAGAYNFKPYIPSVNMDYDVLKNTEHYKKAIEYYSTAMKPNKNSMIDNIVAFSERLNKRQSDDSQVDVSKEDKDLLKKTVASFLHNIVFELNVTNRQNYDEILRAIRYDTELTSHFNIVNAGHVRMFNAEEECLIFTDKHTGTIVAVIIAHPLYAVGSEVIRKIGGLFHNRLSGIKD